jgi:hypothetical protein
VTHTDLGDARSALDPPARDALRRVLIRDQADRDAVAAELLRCHDCAGDELAEIIDTLTMHPEEPRKVVRLLAEIEARPGSQIRSTQTEKACGVAVRL